MMDAIDGPCAPRVEMRRCLGGRLPSHISAPELRGLITLLGADGDRVGKLRRVLEELIDAQAWRTQNLLLVQLAEQQRWPEWAIISLPTRLVFPDPLETHVWIMWEKLLPIIQRSESSLPANQPLCNGILRRISVKEIALTEWAEYPGALEILVEALVDTAMVDQARFQPIVETEPEIDWNLYRALREYVERKRMPATGSEHDAEPSVAQILSLRAQEMLERQARVLGI